MSIHFRYNLARNRSKENLELDRFIPNRSAMDFDYTHYMLTERWKEKKRDKEKSLHLPAKEAFQKRLKEVFGMNRPRILAFSNKPPAPLPLDTSDLEAASLRRRIRSVPQLLFCVGTKLEHIIIQLAKQVVQSRRHSVIDGNVEIHPSDTHFWFHKPRLLLLLIHIILFQNSLEVAFFFWIWVQYGFDSCIMGSIGYTIPRLVIAAFVQFVCSYSTLPLYAIVTQMGSSFNKAIFEDYIQEGLIHWAQKAKKTTTSLHTPNTTKKVTPKRTMSMPAIRLSTATDKQHDQDSTIKEIQLENDHVK